MTISNFKLKKLNKNIGKLKDKLKEFLISLRLISSNELNNRSQISTSRYERIVSKFSIKEEATAAIPICSMETPTLSPKSL